MRYMLSFICCICLLQSCGGLTESEKLKEWKIDEYTVALVRTLGPAGPPFYEYDVYKNDKYLSNGTHLTDTDTCQLFFHEKGDYYVQFNLCAKTKIILTPDKITLDPGNIDSITIRPDDSIRVQPRKTYDPPYFDTIVTKNFDSTISRKLNHNETKEFCKKWNNATPHGYEEPGKSYNYLITVYSKTGIYRFRTFNTYVIENNHWAFAMDEDDSYFEDLWNKPQ